MRYTEVLPGWGVGSSADPGTVEQERAVEILVSKRIGRMSAVHLDVGDQAGPDSVRGYIRANAIALLSEEGRQVDPPTPD